LSEDIKQDGYGLVSAGVIWRANDAWSFSLQGTNLADKEYRTTGYNIGALGILTGFYGPPRQYSLTARYALWVAASGERRAGPARRFRSGRAWPARERLQPRALDLLSREGRPPASHWLAAWGTPSKRARWPDGPGRGQAIA